MGYPGYYLADTSPIEVVTFPVAERPGSSPIGRTRTGAVLAREHTDLVHETDEGVLWVYPQVRRRRWRLIFRVSEDDLEIFETLHVAVDGQRIAFYFVPDVDASPFVSYLVRKVPDFDPQQIDTPKTELGEIIPMYDYVLEMREESEAAQILA